MTRSRADENADGNTEPPDETINGSRLLLTLVVVDVAFAVQQTGVIPAIPTIREQIHASQEWSSWLLTAYLIVATVATPALARLADLHDRRRVMMIALAVFFIGSVLASVAPNIGVLLAARALQGVGGAVYPLSLSLAREHLPPERVGGAIAVLTGAFGGGSAAGVVLGGALASYVTWRAIFVVGAVAIAAGWWLARRDVPPSSSTAQGSFDAVGTALMGVGAVALLVVLTIGARAGWTSWPVLILAAVAVVTAVVWWRWETHHEDPVIDVGIFRNRAVSLANVASSALGWSLFGSYLLVPRLIEGDPKTDGYGLAAGAALTGLLLLPTAAAQTVVGSLSGRLGARVGQGRVLMVGSMFVSASAVVLAFVHVSVPLLVAGGLLLGVGVGAAVEGGSSIATSAVPRDVASVSSALNSTLRRFAGGIGGQISVLVLAASATGVGGAPSHTGFFVAFMVVAALGLAGSVAAAFIPREA